MKRVCMLLVVAMTIGVLPALANPVTVRSQEDPRQDSWILPEWTDMEELGIGFPADELIAAREVAWEGHIPCPTDYLTNNVVQIEIDNLTGREWTELYYVADPETFLSNVDELVEDQSAPGFTLAFQIDGGGLNTPLVYESMNQDGIFEVGETWGFVIQDYNNSLALSPALLDSYGVAFASQGGPPSSGSIIAIPEPNVIVMVLMAGGGLVFVRRKFMI